MQNAEEVLFQEISITRTAVFNGFGTVMRVTNTVSIEKEKPVLKWVVTVTLSAIEL